MKLLRRKFLQLAAGAVALPAVARSAFAQAYPTKPITIVVPFAAGGPTDTIARLLAERLRVSLGQTVIVESATGAGGTIGVGRAARAAPDGYTISLGQNGSHVVTGATYTNLPYDLLNDFEPLSLLVHCAVRGRRKKDGAGQRPEGVHRLAQGQSEPDGRNRRPGQHQSRLRPDISECHGQPPAIRALSRHRSGDAGPGGGPDRHDDLRSGHLDAAGARRQYQDLWRRRRHPAALRARRADRRRGRAAGLPRRAVARPLDAEGHAEAHHRPRSMPR